MSENAINTVSYQLDPATLEKLVTSGDLSGLTPEQRVMYYRARCEAAGLDYRTQPFRYMMTDGKLSLYAEKSATDQLAARDQIALKIVSKGVENEMYVVEVEATNAQGRTTTDIGAVSIKGVGGTNLANAMMKAVTKAKRRATLSLCGLGMTDESEIVGDMRTVDVAPTGEIEVPDFSRRIRDARTLADLDKIQDAIRATPGLASDTLTQLRGDFVLRQAEIARSGK